MRFIVLLTIKRASRSTPADRLIITHFFLMSTPIFVISHIFCSFAQKLPTFSPLPCVDSPSQMCYNLVTKIFRR